MKRQAWPYPYWVAHRGAGKLAPENTLAAFRLGAAHGYRMFECDAKLSADGTVFLLHDATLERTSSGQGMAGELSWSELSQLDAGSWHSRHYAGEPLCSLAALARFCLGSAHALNIEIKPSPGSERLTGQAVAAQADQLWAGQTVPPLLSSFQPESLAGALDSAPRLPRALLLESWWDGWLQTATALQCCAIVAHHRLLDAASVGSVQGAGMRCMSYTVNEASQVRALQALGIDGIITDRIDLFSPAAEPRDPSTAGTP
ncbi:MAG: glycerophosphodiester phosphodiesterase [Betaproteobacteria bacterium]